MYRLSKKDLLSKSTTWKSHVLCASHSLTKPDNGEIGKLPKESQSPHIGCLRYDF